MALTVTSIANALFKKLQGVSSTSDSKQFFEESRAARQSVFLSQVLAQSDLIPTTAPTLADQATSGVVKFYSGLQLTPVAGVSNAFYSDSLKGCIPFNFGDGSYNYALKDGSGNAIPFGQGDWVVDADTGTLTFYTPANQPASMPPVISFYQYVGGYGAVGANPPYLTLLQQTTDPATPPSGYQRIYLKTDGKAYTIDQAGVIKKLGSGGGGGAGRNYLADYYDGSTVTGINLFGAGDATVTWSTNFNYVDTVGNTVNYVGGGGSFFTGQAVTYTNSGTSPTPIGGLTSGTTYYAIRVNSSASAFGLATSQQNANAKIFVTLTSQGSGTQTFVFGGFGGAGTGGGSTTGLTIAQSPQPVRASGTQRLTKTAVSKVNAGFSLDLVMDSADTDGAKIMKLAFKLKTSAAYAAGDLGVSLLDMTNFQVIPLDGNLITPLAPSVLTTGFQALFYATAGPAYRLVFTVLTANASAYTVDFVDWELSLIGGSAPGSITTPWVNYGAIPIGAVTTAPTKGTTVVDRFWARRNGPNLDVRLEYQQSSSGTNGAGAYLFTLPPAIASILGSVLFDITQNAVTTTSGSQALNNTLGHAHTSDNTNSSDGELSLYSATQFRIILKTSGSNTYQYMNESTGYWGLGSTAFVSFGANASIPIQGWTTGASYSTTDLVLKNQPLSTVSAVKTPTASGNSQLLSNNYIDLAPGQWDLTGLGVFDNNATSVGYSDCIVGYYAANGADTTASPAALSTLPGITIYGSPIARNGSVGGTNILQMPAPSITVKVTQTTRVYIGMACSFSAAASGARLTAYMTAVKRPDFSVFGANFTSQLIESKYSAAAPGSGVVWPVATYTWFDMTFIDVPPGEWDLAAWFVSYNQSASSPLQMFYAFIGTVPGNVTTGQLLGENYAHMVNGNANIGWGAMPTIPRYNVTLTTTTRFYLKAQCSGGTCSYIGYKISARRVR